MRVLFIKSFDFFINNPGECGRLGRSVLKRAEENYTCRAFSAMLTGVFEKALGGGNKP